MKRGPKSRRVLCQGVASKYATIKRLRKEHSIPRLCRMLDVSPSGYYIWLKRPVSRHGKDELRLEIEIRAAHKRTHETYGPNGDRPILPNMASMWEFIG